MNELKLKGVWTKDLVYKVIKKGFNSNVFPITSSSSIQQQAMANDSEASNKSEILLQTEKLSRLRE